MSTDFDREWDSRTRIYPGAAPLPSTRAVHITLTDDYASSTDGQVAALVAVNLIGRMTRNFAFIAPDVGVSSELPFGGRLLELLAGEVRGLHPDGRYEMRPSRGDDFRVTLGRAGAGLVAHGSGWNAFVGRGESPLGHVGGTNPIGAAFSAILAASELQAGGLNGFRERGVVNTFDWRDEQTQRQDQVLDAPFGEIWIVGLGSVGSSAAFFLALLSRRWSARLIDGDEVEIGNVTRSPSFLTPHVGLKKVDVVRDHLHSLGMDEVTADGRWFDEALGDWLERPLGTPDILLAAANERLVRSQIESGCPPIQIYATTGSCWQATLLRHIPIVEACSRCLPGLEVVEAPPLCATESGVHDSPSEGWIDVALPPLSFAAGLMTAAEIAKCTLDGYPFTPNRIFFEVNGVRPVRRVGLGRRAGCQCAQRDQEVHRQAIAGSRYAALSR